MRLTTEFRVGGWEGRAGGWVVDEVAVVEVVCEGGVEDGMAEGVAIVGYHQH